MMKVLSAMDQLEPVNSSSPIETRVKIAHAILDVSSTPEDAAILLSLARWESFFRTDVLRCQLRGGGLSLGPWQVQPRTSQEGTSTCSSPTEAAQLALQRVKESLQACKHLPVSERLAVYAAGSCASKQGKSLSRLRWSTAEKILQMNTFTVTM
jgi:hypothetical protein